MNNFGEHLTIDGYKGDYVRLNDKALVLKCLSELPQLVNMNKLAEPSVHFAAGNNQRDLGGWSGFVIIEESHISIHTFPKVGFVSIDVYTCKNNMDTKFIIEYFKKQFKLKNVEVNLIKRGLEYNKHLADIAVEEEATV